MSSWAEKVAREGYVSPHPLPSPRQRELLTILVEECGEVVVAASKLLRFGALDGYPGSNTTNAVSLATELGDVQAMMRLLVEAGTVDYAVVIDRIPRKIEKVAHFLQSAAEPEPESGSPQDGRSPGIEGSAGGIGDG